MNPKYIMQMDDLATLKRLDEVILANRKTLFRKPNKSEGIVIIVSGGLDSTVALARILEEFDSKIYPLYIRRGARAETKELASIHYYLGLFSKKYSNLHKLEVLSAEVPPAKYKVNIPQKQLNSTGHTMRNSMLQSYALQYAVSIGYEDNLKIRTIFTSLSPNDAFPHCRLIALRAETILACIDGDDWSWQVTSPLLEPELWGWVDKTKLIDYAHNHEIDLSYTYTCTDSGTLACGQCQACTERLKAFKDSGYIDPISYEINVSNI
jgi:7-cyano-7-deazaguanine synthase